jgi:hypothetical protein
MGNFPFFPNFPPRKGLRIMDNNTYYAFKQRLERCWLTVTNEAEIEALVQLKYFVEKRIKDVKRAEKAEKWLKRRLDK